MDCKEKILSENYYDVITDFAFNTNIQNNSMYDLCSINLEEKYSLIYINMQGIQNLEENFFEYQRIPKLYAPMQDSLQNVLPDEVPGNALGDIPGGGMVFDSYDWFISGITAVQRPPLNLTGRGVLICIIDSGIDYRNPAFIDENGNSRILALWDQTVQSGQSPDNFPYGSLYSRQDINRALQDENPYSIVPSRDMSGHGTRMAAVACGYIREQYIGSAPEAELVVVKLKEAKKYLRDFYLLPEGALAYQENDIMAAMAFADNYVVPFRRPMVYCLGVGTNQGDHNGSSVLSSYINELARKRSRAMIVCGGNEGNTGHHYRGILRETGEYRGENGEQVLGAEAEIRVAEGVQGLFLEFWGASPDLYSVVIRSPGGEEIPAVPLGLQQSITYRFVYDSTVLTIDSEPVETATGEQLMLFRMIAPTAGIWTFRISARGNIYNGRFDMWLPVSTFLSAQVTFITPSPDVTITEPGMTEEVITVSAYNGENNSFYINSGRGFMRLGGIKPDLAAPGVNISTLRGKETGSSLAAAMTTGAVAQFLQWAVVDGNNEVVETREIKQYLIRGAVREGDMSYPNELWGYGRLNLQRVFEVLAGI
ncbi:MAG: S8 family peptidase [Lachnospiraceae bacterium]|nr:S8 family peptidase [Lachnospiraceae bacterium]